MTEPRREPANDFERWLASSPVLPDRREPRKAQVVLDMLTAVIDGDERRAVLLAALG